jgi:hypothetical protein
MKVFKQFYLTLFPLFIVITILGCSTNNDNNNSKGDRIASSTKNVIKRKIQPEKNELTIDYQTQLVEWGGDGQWHEMYKNDNGKYWVNFSDPFKLILNGHYSNLTVKIENSNGNLVYNKSGINVTKKYPYTISHANLIGNEGTNFKVEIYSNEKIILNGLIESVPGGE